MGRPSSNVDIQAGMDIIELKGDLDANPYPLVSADSGKTFQSNTTGVRQFDMPSWPIDPGWNARFVVLPGSPIQLNGNGSYFYLNNSLIYKDLNTLDPTAPATEYLITHGAVVAFASNTPGAINLVIDSRPQSMDVDMMYGPFDRWANCFQRETDLNPTPVLFKWQSGLDDFFNVYPGATFAANVQILGVHAGDVATPDKRGGQWWSGEICFYKRTIVAAAIVLNNTWGLGAELGTLDWGIDADTFEMSVIPAVAGGVEGRWFARMVGIQGYGTLWT